MPISAIPICLNIVFFRYYRIEHLKFSKKKSPIFPTGFENYTFWAGAAVWVVFPKKMPHEWVFQISDCCNFELRHKVARKPTQAQANKYTNE